MDTALLIARLLLALIFVIAGVTKLADRAGSRQAVIDFGAPAALAKPLGILLPLAELAVAAALIPIYTAWWGAIGALALLLLFIAGIAINLSYGHKPDCHCFGQLHSAPAGWKTLGRSGFLAAVAGLLIWQGYDAAGPSALSLLGWLGALPIAQLVALILGLVVLGVVATQWWFLVHLVRQNGRLLMRFEALETRLAAEEGGAALSRNGVTAPGLPLGSQALNFSLSGLYGETLTLEALRALGKPVMLLFIEPNCGPCNALLPEIGRWQQEHSDKLTISLISRGTAEENRSKSSEHGVSNVVLQEDWEVAEAYRVSGTPSAVLVLPDGTIGSSLIGGVEAVRDLVSYAVGERAQLPMMQAQAQGGPCPNCGKVHPIVGNGATQQAVPAGPKVGEPAPEVKLKDLNGKSIDVKHFRGEKTLVLFWNPGCGFCQQMLDDLKEWESNPPEGAPKLLVVSAGTEEANQEMGLSSPIVLDQQFAVGHAFGAGGTPSAVLVDAEGKIASGLAVGANAVLELSRARHTEA